MSLKFKSFLCAKQFCIYLLGHQPLIYTWQTSRGGESGWLWLVLSSITRDDVLWRGRWHQAHIRCVVWLFLICVLSSTQLIMNIMDISDISLYPLGPHTNQAANLPVRSRPTSPYLRDSAPVHHCGGREERCCPTENWEHQYSIPRLQQVTSFIAWRHQDK